MCGACDPLGAWRLRLSPSLSRHDTQFARALAMPAAQSELPSDVPAYSASTLRLAIVGAGPAGLSLALQAARALPEAHITVFDARPADADVSADARTLALSQGTVQELSRIGVWDAIERSGRQAPIRAVHVSQQQPTVLWPGAEQPEVRISAAEQGVPQLGAVVSYGTLVAPLQAAWAQAVAQDEHRLAMRFGTPVKGLKPVADGIEVDADIAECHDLVVVAEGGVFAHQPKLSWPEGLSHDYEQTAWVGQVLLEDDATDAHDGTAYERFTPSGPAALLPLPPGPVVAGGASGRRAALVWCVQAGDDPVRDLEEAQRLTLLNTIFHPRVGRILQTSPLKAFPLGLNAHRRLVSEGAVVRIGNAAQTLHPVAGQGFNLAMRDVHELLAALKAEAWHTEADVQPQVRRALNRFERRRQPDRLALLATTDFLARSFTWPAPILATARGLGLGVVQQLGPLKRLVARSMMFGWR